MDPVTFSSEGSTEEAFARDCMGRRDIKGHRQTPKRDSDQGIPSRHVQSVRKTPDLAVDGCKPVVILSIGFCPSTTCEMEP